MYLLKTQKALSSTLLREELLLEPSRPVIILTKNIHVLSIQDEENIQRHEMPPKKNKKTSILMIKKK
jgi:hypothetical protein